jgi:hypothetical protein
MGHMGYQDNEERVGITGCYAMIGVALFAFDLSDPALPIRKPIAVVPGLFTTNIVPCAGFYYGKSLLLRI